MALCSGSVGLCIRFPVSFYIQDLLTYQTVSLFLASTLFRCTIIKLTLFCSKCLGLEGICWCFQDCDNRDVFCSSRRNPAIQCQSYRADWCRKRLRGSICPGLFMLGMEKKWGGCNYLRLLNQFPGLSQMLC